MAERKGAQALLAERIEREIERLTGTSVIVEESEDAFILSGRVDTPEARQAAEDIATALAGEKRVDNDLEVEGTVPVEVSDFHHSVAPSAELARDVPELQRRDAELEPDFTDQATGTTTLEAAGVDTAEEADVAYVPPTDPVITSDQRGRAVVLGGFTPASTDDVEVAPSSERELGDEAIADAVRRELREDAATTSLPINVDVRDAVVYLRGTVADVVDAENAEEVASRVPGVREVVEELQIQSV
jgi:osmotically-inducible protein OsmY